MQPEGSRNCTVQEHELKVIVEQFPNFRLRYISLKKTMSPNIKNCRVHNN